ncbi:hypothetical protein PV396_24540 [Streptomyces sp. ME02-8801-2C]|uniref:hypothetical protein n=1 Tax=Streptomyces sp. ME02-8801-2C TaxID=3028680 RepID=UPI0029AC9522|nr:hypothetical protein [Streptomyces sp. ME02-8801-2C]MDX3455071.1 hypothetical protein [Streptomyces sp. ME02-8801-2C]
MTVVGPFRLHLAYQLVLDGWVETDGHTAVAVDDPEYGLTTSAATPEDLIRGYGGGHIEWPAATGEQEPPAQQGAPR